MKHLYLLCILLVLFSCKKETNIVKPAEIPKETVQELGKKLENPYAIRNIKKALNKMMSTSGLSNSETDIKATHKYIRFLPKSNEDLLILDSDSTLFYETVPFGYENSADLDYYQDPDIPQGEYTWLYAIVEHNYIIPNVQHEILEELYEPSDEEDELEHVAFMITGNNDNAHGLEQLMSISDKEIAGLFSKRFRPSGTILVQNSFGGTTPLKRAAIQVKTIWWSNVVQTNDNGYYLVDRRYKHVPSVKIWNRNQTNKTTQKWTEHLGFFVSDKLGKGKTFNYTIAHTNGTARDLWVKATINNAFVIYDDFARQNGIKRPDQVRTWVFQNKEYGGAPLLHNKSLTSYSSFYPAIAVKNKEKFGSKVAKTGLFALSPLLDAITAVHGKHKNLPDIIIGTKEQNTAEIYAKVFHEAAHYSHKNQVSNGYWANVQYQAMFDKTVGTYGDGSPTYSTYTGVAEAWSNFIEYQLMERIGLLSRNDYNKNMTAYEKLAYPSTIPSNYGDAAKFARWIPSGLLRDLMDHKSTDLQLMSGTNYESKVFTGKDRVSGFTFKQIYDLLTEEVTSITKLKQKLINRYPHKNANHQVTELFKCYGY